MNELSIIEKLREIAPGARGLTLGIGDDCAIFQPRAGEELLFTTDQMIEGVHFTRAQSASAIGERALARSLSDIAAMGGEPRFCLVALAVPQQDAPQWDVPRWIEGFFRGLTRLAKRHGVGLAGGDLAHDDKAHCDVMVCGAVPRGKALRRDGARIGDAIYVSGRLGKPWDRRIEPRIALGKSLRGRATACIDVSDGLFLDLHRLCLASNVSAELHQVPVTRGSTLDRALYGGEDYELLFTLSKRANPPRGVTRIGEMGFAEPGTIWFLGQPIIPHGYDHFQKNHD